MTNPIPYMSSGQPLGFTNQRGMLIAIGIMFILVGAFFGCLVGVMPFIVVAMSRSMPQGSLGRDAGSMLVGLIVYGILAAGMISCGYGAVRIRRWIRPVLIILSTLTLAVGIVSVVTGIITSLTMGDLTGQNSVVVAQPTTGPTTTANFSVARAQGIAMVAGVLIGFVFLIVIPGALLWFMRLPSVRLTIEHYDPQMRWTDRRPFPVLAITLTCWLWGLSHASQAASGMTTLFGTVFSGPVGTLMALTLMLIGAVTGYLIWKQLLAGWWMAVLTCTALMISSIASALFVTYDEIFAAMNLPPETLQQLQSTPGGDRFLAAMSVAVFMLPALVYLIRQRRYFFTDQQNNDFDGSAPALPQA